MWERGLGNHATQANDSTHWAVHSIQIVPEPASVVLMGLGAALMFRRRPC